MRVAVMQPYLFPYIGYFQLIDKVDHFIFLDNVRYIKSGWINRNKILVNGREKIFSVPVVKANSDADIQVREVNRQEFPRVRNKLLATIAQSYAGAGCFDAVSELVETILNEPGSIADMAITSVCSVCNYLETRCMFSRASQLLPDTESRMLGAQERVIELVQRVGGDAYLNMIGGRELYEFSEFEAEGISLCFLAQEVAPYPQLSETFVPGLSIIDMLMHIGPAEVRQHLAKGRLVLE